MQKDIVYYNGDFIAKSEVSISPDDRGFLFADGVYEVFRSYFGKFFYFDLHIKRLSYSLNELSIPFSNVSEIENISKKLLNLNNLENKDAIIYIQITRGVAHRTHHFPDKTIPTIYICVKEIDYPLKYLKNGINVITVPDNRWGRCDIKTISLLPNVLANQKAYENNAQEAIFVKDGLITEGTHTGIFGVKNGEVITHPKTKHILPSITREIITILCRNKNIPLKERPIFEEKLTDYDEIFVVGTSTEITPVVKVNNKVIANGEPGKVTQLLQKAFTDHVDSGK